MTKFEFQAIGTSWTIDINKDLSKEAETFLFEEIMDRVKIFDSVYSRFREDSLITKMSKKKGDYTLPDDADLMITLYEKMYEITDGQVTPLIGQVLVDAGYDAQYSLIEKVLSTPPSWSDTLIWRKPDLTLLSPALLDFGAGGKGYLVDIVSGILEKNDICSYCVDAGGDMRYRSEKGDELRVGLEHPEDTSTVIGVVKIINKSICGSAGNRRKWGNFNHIINPETLKSPSEMLSVWVIAENTLLADLLTTALFFTTPDKLNEHFDFEYFILRSDYSIDKSSNFIVEFFA